MTEREDPTPEQYEQTVAQWWRDPEYELWLDKLEHAAWVECYNAQRKDEDEPDEG